MNDFGAFERQGQLSKESWKFLTDYNFIFLFIIWLFSIHYTPAKGMFLGVYCNLSVSVSVHVFICVP